MKSHLPAGSAWRTPRCRPGSAGRQPGTGHQRRPGRTPGGPPPLPALQSRRRALQAAGSAPPTPARNPNLSPAWAQVMRLQELGGMEWLRMAPACSAAGQRLKTRADGPRAREFSSTCKHKDAQGVCTADSAKRSANTEHLGPQSHPGSGRPHLPLPACCRRAG